MLIYLVGQDRKSDDEEGAMGPSPTTGDQEPDKQEVGSPVNPLGLDIGPHWVDYVQEQPACTFSR